MEPTRSSSPWIWALTAFGPSSRMILLTFLAFSWEMPSSIDATSWYSLPDSVGLAGVQRLQRDPALDQLGLEDVEDGLDPVLGVRLHQDLLAADQEIEAPTPLKS